MFYEDYSYCFTSVPPLTFEEKDEVTALIKKNLQYATFISQDSITVSKEFLILAGVKSVVVDNRTKPEVFTLNTAVYANFVGFAYAVTFGAAGYKRLVAVVTKQQYVDSLELLYGKAVAQKWKKDTKDEDFYFLATTHCEEGYDGAPPIPFYQPMGLSMWSTTKLVQRLGFEGINCSMPGLIVKMPNSGSHVTLNQKLIRIDNQKSHHEHRLF